MAKLSIDPITLEVVQNALSSIADELALVIMRAAYSNIVRIPWITQQQYVIFLVKRLLKV